MDKEKRPDIDERFKSNEKIFRHGEWLKKYELGEDVYPICWEIDASNKCAYGCSHCCWAEYIDEHRDVLSWGDLMRLVQEIKDLGGKSIIWSGGGDPLTNPAIGEIVQFSQSLGIENAMFTNGLGMNQKIAELLADSLVWIRFHMAADNSADFARVHRVPERYFEIVTKNIRHFVELEGRGANVGIGGPVNQDNFDASRKLPELAMHLGADFYQAKLDLERLASFEYSEWWYEIAVPFYEREKERLNGRVRYFSNTVQSALEPDYCHAHRIITAVTADGNVAFCKMRRGDVDTNLGNIRQQSLKQILDGEIHRSLARKINLATCEVAQVHCPYRKTIQSVEIYLKGAGQDLSVPTNTEYINFF